jgi:hypothetical protein
MSPGITWALSLANGATGELGCPFLRDGLLLTMLWNDSSRLVILPLASKESMKPGLFAFFPILHQNN